MALRVAAALTAVVAVAVWLLGPARDSTIPDHLTGKALYRLPGPMLAFALSIAFVHVSRVRRAATVADDVRQRTDRNNTALIIAMSGALIAAFSWVVLAKHHSAYHTTVNALLFSMLFVPLLAAWLGHTLSATIITQRALAGARSEVDGS
jgi:hypothetical protein